MLLSSKLVLMDNVTWLTFDSAYNFSYLLSQLTCQSLPESESEFLETLKIYFPNLCDIKYLMLSTDNLMGGLQKVANKLKVKRIGSQHKLSQTLFWLVRCFSKFMKNTSPTVWMISSIPAKSADSTVVCQPPTLPSAIGDWRLPHVCGRLEDLHSSMQSPMRDQW